MKILVLLTIVTLFSHPSFSMTLECEREDSNYQIDFTLNSSNNLLSVGEFSGSLRAQVNQDPGVYRNSSLVVTNDGEKLLSVTRELDEKSGMATVFAFVIDLVPEEGRYYGVATLKSALDAELASEKETMEQLNSDDAGAAISCEIL